MYVASVIGAFYYLRIVKMMYFDDVTEALDGRLLMPHRVALGASGLVMAIGWLPFLNGFGVVEISGPIMEAQVELSHRIAATQIKLLKMDFNMVVEDTNVKTVVNNFRIKLSILEKTKAL